MMNMPLISRTKFCSLQETKAGAVLGGVMVAGFAGGAVAGSPVLGTGFRLTGEVDITCQYTYQDGVIPDGNHCSSFFDYRYTISGIDDEIAYNAIRSGWGGQDYDPEMCPLSMQIFALSAGSSGDGASGYGYLTVQLRELPPQSTVLVDRTTNVFVRPEGRTSLLTTSFTTGTVSYSLVNTSTTRDGLIHAINGPSLNLTVPGSYRDLILWPGVYTLSLNGEGFLQRTGTSGGWFYSTVSSNFSILSESTLSPPLCTGTNRCADYNNDGNFDLADLYGWYASPMDVTGDELFDADPYSDDAAWIAGMLLATDETLNDCNENGFPDVYDIFIGAPFGGSDDTNADGIPDECQAADCPADLTGDGSLDFFDVSAFLTAFGNQDPVADFTNDGSFDFFDVSAFLTAFSVGCP